MKENEKKDDLFRFVEYSAEAAERTGYSDYSYWKSVFQNFLKKKSAVFMAIVFFALVIFSFTPKPSRPTIPPAANSTSSR